MNFGNAQDVIALTRQWKGSRLPDGRPFVPDRYLDKFKEMTLEEIWKPMFVQGYENQFLSIKSLHPEFDGTGKVEHKMIGRALTAMYAPTRPDYHENAMLQAKEQGWEGTPNQWVMDRLCDRDVLVVDMFDKIYKGTFLGGNLTTALRTKTHTGGAVIWGGIRDVEQMMQTPDVQVYYRGIDPTPIRQFDMLGMNCPVRLGQGEHAAVCLPGDVVYGCSGGVLFIPPQLVIQVVENGDKTKVKDIFGFDMISKNVFTTAQIDKNIWSESMLDLLLDFIKKDPRGEPFRDLDWSTEYENAKCSEKDGASAL